MAKKNGESRGGKANRGFAVMDPEKQKEIARKGGIAAHAQGRAHEFSSEEARAAGRKGGVAVSRDRAHMAEIGRAGGMVRGERKRKQELELERQLTLEKEERA